MDITKKESILIEIYAKDECVLELEDGTYTTYVCVPSSYDISKIKEIKISEIENHKIIEELKQEKLNDITKYDTSNNVNEFFVNGMPMWVARETRVSLHNSTEILIKKGINTTVLWEGNIKFELPCDILIQILDEVEVYALKCFNVTAEHKSNVMNLNTREEIIDYNFKTNYPNKLTFEL